MAAPVLSSLVDADHVARRIIGDASKAAKRRVHALAREGVLDGVAVRIGRRLRFDPDALERWIEKGGRALPGGWRRRRAGADD